MSDETDTDQIMTDRIHDEGLAYVQSLERKTPSNPLMDTPLQSIATPKGWKTIVLLLEYEPKFEKAVKILNVAWRKAVDRIKAKRKKKPTKDKSNEATVESPKEASQKKTDESGEVEICTGPALGSRVREVVRERYHQSVGKLRGKLSDEQRNEQQKILEEAKAIMKRYGWPLNPKKTMSQAAGGVAKGAKLRAKASSKPDKPPAPGKDAQDGVAGEAPKPEPPEDKVKKPEESEPVVAKPKAEGGGKADATARQAAPSVGVPIPQAEPRPPGDGNAETTTNGDAGEGPSVELPAGPVAAKLASQDEARSGEPASVLTPPLTETPVPRVEPKPLVVDHGKTVAKVSAEEKPVVDPPANPQEPEKKAATKRKSDKGKNGELIADEAMRTDQPNEPAVPALVPQDKARPVAPIPVPAPPTVIPVPKAEPKSPGDGNAETTTEDNALERISVELPAAPVAVRPEATGEVKPVETAPLSEPKGEMPVPKAEPKPQGNHGDETTAKVDASEKPALPLGGEKKPVKSEQNGTGAEVKGEGEGGAAKPVSVQTPPPAEMAVPKVEQNPPVGGIGKTRTEEKPVADPFAGEEKKPTGAKKATTETGANQLCPNCNGPMEIKVVKKTGKQFLGCSAFPKCKGTRSLYIRVTSTPTPKGS